MTRPITPSDLWKMYRVGQPEHLPGSNTVVVPVTDYHDENRKPHTVLHLVDRDGTTRRLTERDLNVSAPVPSPDGNRVAFLAKDDDDNNQLHVIDSDGGNLRKVCEFPKGVTAVRWVPGSDAVVAAVPLYRSALTIEGTTDEAAVREGRRPPVRTEDRVYRYWKRWLAGETVDHLFRIDLSNGDAVDLTPSVSRLMAYDEVGSAFTITPDGSTVIFTLDDSDPGWEYLQFRLHTVPVAGGPVTRLGTRDASRHVRPRVSPDGTMLVYGAQFERAYYAAHVEMIAHDLPTGAEHKITPGWDRSAGGWEFIDNATVVFHAEDEGHVRLFTVDVSGGTPLPMTSAGSNHGPRPGTDSIWHRSEAIHQPPEVAVTASGHTTLVTGFNSVLVDELDLRPAEEIRFAGSADRQIQAFVVEPPGFTPEQTWPLLQNVHGGPHNGVTDSWHWRWNPQVMAADGRVVMSVNFHGSSSFGDDFARSIRGAWGEMPAADVEAGTNHLIDLGFIDADRMAIAGGSYGGYLVTWITTQTDRYNASICHAGVTDLLGQWASDVTEGREHGVGGVPWEDLDAVLKWSPTAHTHDIVTPTLVIHGEMDYRVVVTQGLELYGILKHKGVPSRLVYFHDEGHWIENHTNAMIWWDEFLAWLERWGV